MYNKVTKRYTRMDVVKSLIKNTTQYAILYNIIVMKWTFSKNFGWTNIIVLNKDRTASINTNVHQVS